MREGRGRTDAPAGEGTVSVQRGCGEAAMRADVRVVGYAAGVNVGRAAPGGVHSPMSQSSCPPRPSVYGARLHVACHHAVGTSITSPGRCKQCVPPSSASIASRRLQLGLGGRGMCGGSKCHSFIPATSPTHAMPWLAI